MVVKNEVVFVHTTPRRTPHHMSSVHLSLLHPNPDQRHLFESKSEPDASKSENWVTQVEVCNGANLPQPILAPVNAVDDPMFIDPNFIDPICIDPICIARTKLRVKNKVRNNNNHTIGIDQGIVDANVNVNPNPIPNPNPTPNPRCLRRARQNGLCGIHARVTHPSPITCTPCKDAIHTESNTTLIADIHTTPSPNTIPHALTDVDVPLRQTRQVMTVDIRGIAYYVGDVFADNSNTSNATAGGRPRKRPVQPIFIPDLPVDAYNTPIYSTYDILVEKDNPAQIGTYNLQTRKYIMY